VPKTRHSKVKPIPSDSPLRRVVNCLHSAPGAHAILTQSRYRCNKKKKRKKRKRKREKKKDSEGIPNSRTCSYVVWRLPNTALRRRFYTLKVSGSRRADGLSLSSVSSSVSFFRARFSVLATESPFRFRLTLFHPRQFLFHLRRRYVGGSAPSRPLFFFSF